MNGDKNGYRLPTEAEWEYACRSGSTTAYCNGGISALGCNLEPNLNAVGWCRQDIPIAAHDLMSKQWNNWFIRDLHGNVMKLCWDMYEDYTPGTVNDPISGTGANPSTKSIAIKQFIDLAASYVQPLSSRVLETVS